MSDQEEEDYVSDTKAMILIMIELMTVMMTIVMIDDDCDDTHGKPPILELRPSAPHVGCVLEMVICIVVCVQSDQLMYCMSVHLSFWSFQTKTS